MTGAAPMQSCRRRRELIAFRLHSAARDDDSLEMHGFPRGFATLPPHGYPEIVELSHGARPSRHEFADGHALT